MTPETPTATVAQTEPRRIKLQPVVLMETALSLRVHAAAKGVTQGELIDMLVGMYLPPVTVPPVETAPEG